nr:uncharacterized protein LOC113737716 [Coffea arabica]
MVVSKWTMNFRNNQEPSIVLIWVVFPGLPIPFFAKQQISKLAATLGRVLKIDSATATLRRPLVARVLVEMDVATELAKRIWIGDDDLKPEAPKRDIPRRSERQLQANARQDAQQKHPATEGDAAAQPYSSSRAQEQMAQSDDCGQKDQMQELESERGADSHQRANLPLVEGQEERIPSGEDVGDSSTMGGPSVQQGLAQNPDKAVATEFARTAVEGQPLAATDNVLLGVADKQVVTHSGEGDVAASAKDPMVVGAGVITVDLICDNLPTAIFNGAALAYRGLSQSFDNQCGGNRDSVSEGEADEDFEQETAYSSGGQDLNTNAASVGVNVDHQAMLGNGRKPTKKKGVWVLIPSDRQLRSSVTSTLAQHVSFSVQHPWLANPLTFSFVHAKCTLEGRRALWQDLLDDKPGSHGWCVCGDFNVIVDPNEKQGGRPFSSSEGVELLAFMEGAEVFDAGFSGSRFTWCNNRQRRDRIWKQLDRVLINGAFTESAPSLAMTHLARHPSDHAPVMISFTSRMDNKPRAFRFLNLWTSHPGLLDVVKQAWQVECPGSPLRALCSKLLRTMRAMQEWNKGIVGNVFEAVRRAEALVLAAESRTESDGSVEAQVELSKAQAELRHALLNEEKFWGQKAKVKWLRYGDRNSRYFHATVQQRKAEKVTLEACPTPEEVKKVVFELDGDSAAGPDGFTSQFFTFAWDIIAKDVYNAVLSLFCGAELPRFLTSTSIVLIPKVPSPHDFSKYRPISLCNFFNKVLSRILADRLARILPKILSPQQIGFVKGRNITENYLLAQELMSGLGTRPGERSVKTRYDKGV